eukprot:TRINITY_DN1932_c0_g1_i1.p1 TRINITY_DN1932_c0_g1~~TRINITY_DN1932_c0_g1_i1.p1  ORF type:complete len:740 (-),score=229.98 TRINITY_DN1932_c0_g1_i1:186-2405(-)
MAGLQGLQQTFPVEEVFNTMSRKLLVYVMGAKGITKAGMKGPPDVFCKVSLGKDTHKTKTVKKTTDPDFGGELLLFRLDGNAELVFELRDKTNAIKDEFLGIATLSNIESKFKANVVYDERIELGGRKAKSNKKPDAVSGTLFFRLMWSDAPETRPDSAIDDHNFFYEEHIGAMKSGDLLAYDGHGFVSSYIKLASNSQFSHVGMILQLPNRWTRKIELYVVEVSRNIDQFLDAFKEVPLAKANLNIFRLFERLHQVHASNVWLIPSTNYSQVSPEFQVILNALVNNQTQLQTIVKEIIPDTFGGAIMDESTCAVPSLVRYVKKIFGKQRSPYVFAEMFGYVREIYSTAAMIRLSRSLGRHHQPQDTRMIYPVEFILNHSLFRTPILLRTLKEGRQSQVVMANNGTLRNTQQAHAVAHQQPQPQGPSQVQVLAPNNIQQQQPVQTMRYNNQVSYPATNQAYAQTMRASAGQFQAQGQPVQQQQPQGYTQQQYPTAVQYPQQGQQYPPQQVQYPSQAPTPGIRTGSGQFQAQGQPVQQPPQGYPQQGQIQYSSPPPQQYSSPPPQQYSSPAQPSQQQYSNLVSPQPPSYSSQPQQGAAPPQYSNNQTSYGSFPSSPARDSQSHQPTFYNSTPNLPSYSQHEQQSSQQQNPPPYLQRKDTSDLSTISMENGMPKEQVYHNRNSFATMRGSEDHDAPKGMSYPDLFSPDGFAMNLPAVPTTVPSHVQQTSKPQRSSGSLVPG